MKRLEKRLDKILEEILEMHELARRSVEICLSAAAGDEKSKKEVVRLEKETDVLETEIDFDCMSVIALFQPVARDLRFALGMIKISSSYERIADLAQEIGMYDVALPNEFFHIQKIILRIFDRIMGFYRRGDSTLRDDLICLDDELDLFYSEFIESISERRCLVKEVVDIILIARHLERMGDLLLKIGQRLIFIEKGTRVWIK